MAGKGMRVVLPVVVSVGALLAVSSPVPSTMGGFSAEVANTVNTAGSGQWSTAGCLATALSYGDALFVYDGAREPSRVVTDASTAGNNGWLLGPRRSASSEPCADTGPTGIFFRRRTQIGWAGPWMYNPATYTMAAWVNTTRATGVITRFSGASTVEGDRQLYLTGGVLAFGVGIDGQGGWLSGGPAIDDGQWHHVAVTVDGANAVLYVDGTSVATTVLSSSGRAVTGWWWWGAGPQGGWPGAAGGNAGFVGGMRVIAGYDRALTPGEVAALAVN